jgi:hypothetical protein
MLLISPLSLPLQSLGVETVDTVERPGRTCIRSK